MIPRQEWVVSVDSEETFEVLWIQLEPYEGAQGLQALHSCEFYQRAPSFGDRPGDLEFTSLPPCMASTRGQRLWPMPQVLQALGQLWTHKSALCAPEGCLQLFGHTCKEADIPGRH